MFSGADDEIQQAHKGERPPLRAMMAFAMDPPEFERMAEWPELQLLCRNYWEAFHPEWNREKMQLAHRLHEQVRELNIQQIVKERSRQARHKPRPFRLRLHFTRWPEDYRRAVSENHLVLGIGYLDDARIDDLRAVLCSHISELI